MQHEDLESAAGGGGIRPGESVQGGLGCLMQCGKSQFTYGDLKEF